ncbi:MAG: riboflavin synthase [Pseudoalteromonas tetraodonis]|jgi:riboflavin synthase
MFTGLVEATGTVITPATRGQDSRLVIEVGASMAGELSPGDSVATNGCCLTATEIDPDAGTVAYDLLAETLRVTNLGDLETGSLVNLERALRADQRLGGHFVQGHVDTTARVVDFSQTGNDFMLQLELPGAFKKYVISKGSIAIDGISLTVATLDDEAGTLTCYIIPHTIQETHLKTMASGQMVNLEFDVLAKYVERQLLPESRQHN